ncbi:MAG TPA: alpha/beta hydrolase [Bryobacteraceae bacterium]|nr:alpha/beta hydrolase [Bryobacteraceae bacterium]
MTDLRATLLLFVAAPAFAQLSPSAAWATHAANEYQAVPNLTYVTASNYEAKLDIYKRRDTSGPQATVVYFHGGFWAAGAKEAALMSLLPWFEMGWNVVNVEYRLARIAPAPAAVEDCLCALKYIVAQAKNYDIDVNRIVVTGESAGGHLALTTGMIPASAGLDNECTGPRAPRVAAIINWFGITDVMDVIEGPNRRDIAATWLAGLPNREEIAKRVSPLTYVRPGLPPILTIHGDADNTVPYPEAVKLHEALTQAHVPNQLLTIPGGKHGNFSNEERARIFLTIREFLSKNGINGKS